MQDTAIAFYDEAIARGIAKEQARVFLPEGLTKSTMYMAGSIRSWIHYIQLRTEAGRDVIQQSSPVVAENIKEVTIQQTPLWMLVLLVLGWLFPSPNEIARSVRGLFKK